MADGAAKLLPSTPSSFFDTHQVKLPALSSLYEQSCNSHHHNYTKTSCGHGCCGNNNNNSCSNNGNNSLLITPMMTPQSSPNLYPKYQQNYPQSEELRPTYLEKVPKMTTLDNNSNQGLAKSDSAVKSESNENSSDLKMQLKELSFINELLQKRVYQLEVSESSIRESELRLRHRLQEEERRNEELRRRLREIMNIM
jgi:hypothetical protein